MTYSNVAISDGDKRIKRNLEDLRRFFGLLFSSDISLIAVLSVIRKKCKRSHENRRFSRRHSLTLNHFSFRGADSTWNLSEKDFLLFSCRRRVIFPISGKEIFLKDNRRTSFTKNNVLFATYQTNRFFTSMNLWNTGRLQKYNEKDSSKYKHMRVHGGYFIYENSSFFLMLTTFFV